MTGAASRRAKLLASLLICAAAAVPAGCGPDEEPDDPITISRSAGPNDLDPALASGAGALEALWLVYTPLLTYRHAEGDKGAELIPGLASDLPRVSSDGRTYSLRLREGLEYSDGSPVRAGDFEHALARTLHLDSGAARLYDGIEGAGEYLAAGDPEAEIEGIDSDDETGEITITLDAPDPRFADALALPYAAPVPARTPSRDLSAAPPPGVGPYEIASTDADGGFVLRRSPTFAELDIPDIPTGNIAEITTLVVPGERRQAQDVLDGKLDYMQSSPPAALRPTILEQAGERLIEHPAPATWYAYFDRRRPPFADPLVREAVNTALDRPALARTYSGEPGCALLAPGVPGYDEVLDTDECPYGDPRRPPDLAAARALIRQAGAAGARVGVARGRDGDGRALARAYVATLDRIGLEATLERAHRAKPYRHRCPRPPASPRARVLRRGGRARRSPDRGRARPPRRLDRGQRRLGGRCRRLARPRPVRGLAAAELRRAAGPSDRRHLLLGAHGPGERGPSSRVSQRLLELAAEGGRVAPGANGYECPPWPRPRPRFSRLS